MTRPPHDPKTMTCVDDDSSPCLPLPPPSSFSSLRFVRLSDLPSSSLPLLPSEFEALVETHCREARDQLVNQ